MSTVQVVGIGIATVILVALVFSLIITRRKDAAIVRATRPETPPVTADTASFLFEAPRDDLHMLGDRDTLREQEAAPAADSQPAPASQPGGPKTPGAASEPDTRAPFSLTPVAASHEVFSTPTPASADLGADAVTGREPSVAPPTPGPEKPNGLGFDPPLWLPQPGIEPWARPTQQGQDPADVPSEPQEPPAAEAKALEPIHADHAHEIAETPPSATPEDERPPVSHEEPEAAASVDAAEPEPAPASGEAPQAHADEDAAGLPERPRPVALSDIIVTTNDRRVDLADPEVRRMLKDLAKDEIDLAAQYRQLGQNVDALMQLTEAEHICTALGMTSHTKLIQQMIRELQA